MVHYHTKRIKKPKIYKGVWEDHLVDGESTGVDGKGVWRKGRSSNSCYFAEVKRRWNCSGVFQ
eukprot:6957182-Prorocentrum_lima.AAC.1